jgi:hypothetical protein
MTLVTAPLGAQVSSPPRADTLSMWIVRGADTLAVGRQLHFFSVRRESGVALLFRVVITDAAVFGPRIDTLISHLDSGYPVRWVTATPQMTDRIDVTGGRAKGRVTGAGDQPVDLDVAVPEGSLHAANIDLELSRRLLPVGDVLTLHLFIPNAAGGGDAQFRVEGIETIGAEQAWRIRALNLGNRLTLWVSQRDRRILRQTMVGPNGVAVLFDRRPLPAPPPRP